ncbi:hypothetical protein D7Z26_19400 [Cohnella endophytica]|uniref:Uncharacterized protein n=1 Tax=Cohnella endophytica TaxID=2419778 RepID=A0A494XGW5_9BACL|nr:hypothetical protein [Cohnella endophytica]RKP49985.1 hypothetical protein D7Z26_19400 [Cohnella endophytica]
MGLLYTIYQSVQESRELEEEADLLDDPLASEYPESLLTLLNRPIGGHRREGASNEEPSAES